MTTFGDGLSRHPDAATATGEAIGQVLEHVGFTPPFASLFVSGGHIGAFDDIVQTVRATLGPSVLIGATTGSLLGGPHEVEGQAAVSILAGDPGPCRPIRLSSEAVDGGMRVDGLAPILAAGQGALILLADPYSLPVDALIDHLDREAPDVRVVGGMVDSGRGFQGNRLVLDVVGKEPQLAGDGAVGVLLERDRVDIVVSQGCRPIGEPLIVTRSEGRLLYDLAGQSALERLQQLINGLTPDDQALAAQGIHLGVVVDESKLEFGPGDFLIRNVMGVDAGRGAVAVGATVEVGTTVQFHVRDAGSADDDLRTHLAGRNASGALVFTCNGRGRNLFDEPHHDAAAVHEVVGVPLAGMFCGGEVGPVGGHNHLHGFTASIALFR